ncbi:MAG: ROK family glucokinase [Actinomycetia bacterium]|nr:ROK family glucokinase [Actinomycetes bacterium]
MTSLAIGVDIGGTKIAAGVVDEAGAIVDTTRRPTPSTDVAETERVIADAVAELRSRHEVVAVGVGAAGWIANDLATVLFSPHLAWRDEPLRAALADRIGVPVTVENDANAAAWAEHRFGAARGADVVVAVTLGTGIGGGLVAHGSLYRGAHGVGGEFGHMTVVPDGRRCACGNRGCWEMYASGTALARDARELAEASPVAAHRMLALVGDDPDRLTGPVVTQAARDGDPAALGICAAMGRWLGLGLANLAAVIDPTVFVIGGGLCAAGDLLLAPARDAFAHALAGRGFRPMARVAVAALGPAAGLVGAAELARRAAQAGTVSAPSAR